MTSPEISAWSRLKASERFPKLMVPRKSRNYMRVVISISVGRNSETSVLEAVQITDSGRNKLCSTPSGQNYLP